MVCLTFPRYEQSDATFCLGRFLLSDLFFVGADCPFIVSSSLALDLGSLSSSESWESCLLDSAWSLLLAVELAVWQSKSGLIGF